MTKKMTKAKILKFKKLFEEKRNVIINIIKAPNIEVDVDGDEVDVVQGAVLNDLREKLSMRDIESLNKINDALLKIENGTFGDCEECGELISEKRLEAVLGCKLCIDCAEDAEILRKQYA